MRPPSPSGTPPEIVFSDHLPQDDYVVWLGHASLWIGIGGVSVAIDPVLGNIPMFRRHTPLPFPKEVLKADLILITHAHYDHFDAPSLIELLRLNPDVTVVAPQGFWRYLKRLVPRERCFELEWWESVMVCGLFITLTPAKHWSRRTPFDTNRALWGGYVIQNHEHCVFHAGDTAYDAHFAEIAEHFAIDEAFLPIGAYRPEEVMKENHLDPAEAVQAFRDLGAKRLIPIHYGTFRLSDEPLDEPPQILSRIVESAVEPIDVQMLRIGEIYRFNTTSTERST